MAGSVRARITFAATACAALLLVGASVVVVAVLRWQLLDNLDEGLSNRASFIATLVESGAGVPDDEDVLVQVVGPSGDVLAGSANLRAPTGAATLDQPIAPLETGIRTVGTVPGRTERFRAVTRPATYRDGPAVLIVAVNYDDVRDPVRITAGLLAVTVPLLVGASGALAWTLIGRTLRPVEQMRSQMAAITATDLGRRVPEPDSGDEIARLARTMNGTLDRLEDALRRQQRFVADASHELRSPLTRIRTELEVELSRPAGADLDRAAHSVLAETVAMQTLVEDLLQLARADAGAVAPAAPTAVDLDDIVLREVRRAGERGHVHLDASGVSAAGVLGDASQLARVVRNLLDNAVRHAARTVTVTLGESGGRARLTVADDGSGIPADQRELIFERFTRLDESRARIGGGSGLGLAIVREIVERHGGTVALASHPTTTFVVELPSLA